MDETTGNGGENITMLRLYGGDLLIGKAVRGGEGVYALEDPRMVMMVPTMRGEVHVAMRPVCAPFKCDRLEKRLDVPYGQVMFAIGQDELEKELADGYRSEVSGIKIATAAETAGVLAASQPKAGEFTL